MNAVDLFGRLMIYAIVAVIVYRLFLAVYAQREKIKAFTAPVLKKLFPPIKEQPTADVAQEITINGVKYTKTTDIVQKTEVLSSTKQ